MARCVQGRGGCGGVSVGGSGGLAAAARSERSPALPRDGARSRWRRAARKWRAGGGKQRTASDAPSRQVYALKEVNIRRLSARER